MKNFKRIVPYIYPGALLAEIEQRPHLWDEITARQDYEGSAHKDTETIFLRAPASTGNVLEELNSIDMPAIATLSPAVVDTMKTLAGAIGVRELGRAMLVKLKAGGRITPHTDQGGYARYYARFHYVLSSSAGCVFTVGDETVRMAPGELWNFDHQKQHRVVNDGTDRIHLIFDATAPGFTGALG